MKIKILFDLENNKGRGGGCQFLRTLARYFENNGLLTQSENDASVFIFNSHQDFRRIINLKYKFPEKVFIHRVDGPMSLYNQMNDKRDKLVNFLNEQIADGTIFQSKWSREKNYEFGLKKNIFETVILNAPDYNFFNTKEKKIFSNKEKIRIISTSWSSNFKKGFYLYKWLDKKLNFNKFEFTFIGNSPTCFSNINNIGVVQDREGMSRLLKEHDIFITASENDPCSNSLIEAMHCGLPAVALNSGGHPEIIKKGGELFNKKEEIIPALNKIISNYSYYQEKIELPGILEVAKSYKDFSHKVLSCSKKNKYRTKRVNIFNRIRGALMSIY